MATLTRSVTVDASAEEVFDYVADIRKLWVAPEMVLTDIVQTPDGVGSSARIWTHALGFHMEGSLTYTEVVRPRRIQAAVGFAMEHPTWTFTFEPAGSGTTLTAQGEWHVRIPVVGETLAKRMAKEHEEFVDQLLAHVKTEVEAKATASV